MVLDTERDDKVAVDFAERIGRHNESASRLSSTRPDRGFDIRWTIDIRHTGLDPERGRGGSERLCVECSAENRGVRVDQKSNPRDSRRDFLQNAQPFAR
jgi:hypothetical protein